MPVSTTIEHDTNPMPAQCWYTVTGAGPATPMQYRGVLHAGVSMPTEYTLPPTRYRLNVGPVRRRWPASIYTRYTDPMPS